LPGTLAVESVPGGLSYLLTDAAGRPVVGPVVLQRAESAPVLATCPAGSGSRQIDETFR
jgi:hypothetical protein